MILLDTNVISELMRVSPDHNVHAWINGQDAGQLYLSTITMAEIWFGVQVLPEGNRRDSIILRFQQFVSLGFTQRVAVFDESAAVAYGEVMARRRSIGRPMSVLDGQIAAIARSNGARVATRNITDFERCGIELINPWD